MRILFLTPFLPDPAASHGGGSYLGALAEGLKEKAELGLVSLRHANEGLGPDTTWSWQGSADYAGAPRGMTHRLRMLWRWRNRPLLAAKYWQPEFVEHIETARREFAPDVVLVELAQMAQYLPALRGLPTVLTDHEAGRPANAHTGLGAAADRRDSRLWRSYIQKHYAQATVIQAVTQEDADALAQQTGREVLVRPPTLHIPDTACQPGAAAKAALFLGDYRHSPNPEAATRLATEVWPLVRKAHPDAELLLAGPHEAPIRSLNELPGVRVIGFVPDLAELLGRVRVVLAPLWSGGGFRVKNATALAHGVPVVTNELGSRGCLADDPACLVAETADELANATMRHLDSVDFASAAGTKARNWARAQYAPAAVAQLQLDRLQQLLG
ncbi:MAG: hypothetical protein ACI89X_000208 [Planctomycetota bacterium]